jgi:hypothetical protein
MLFYDKLLLSWFFSCCDVSESNKCSSVVVMKERVLFPLLQMKAQVIYLLIVMLVHAS